MGQNFTPSAVTEQLSLFVLSYDSFRTSKKEGRKAYQENGYLAEFAKWMDDPSVLLADTDETALIQVIRYLNPVVIVDGHRLKAVPREPCVKCIRERGDVTSHGWPRYRLLE